MVRQQTSLNQQATVPESPQKQKRKRKRRTPTEVETSTLGKTLQAREDGKKTHLHAQNMMENYTGHVC